MADWVQIVGPDKQHIVPAVVENEQLVLVPQDGIEELHTYSYCKCCPVIEIQMKSRETKEMVVFVNHRDVEGGHAAIQIERPGLW